MKHPSALPDFPIAESVKIRACRAVALRRRVNPWVIICSTGPLFFVLIDSAFAIAGVDTAPAPAPPHEVTFAEPKETTLENGLRVIVAERPDLPLLAVQFQLNTGAEVDPDGRAGAASMAGT